jgi:hypothetical protein
MSLSIYDMRMVAVAAATMMVMLVSTADLAHADPARAKPGASQQVAHPGTADPACRVRVGDVRMTAAGSRGYQHRTVTAGAVLICGSVVHNMSLQVTLWKTGFFYDHEQAQTAVRAASGTHLADFMTRVNCKDQATSSFFAVAYAVVYFGGSRGDAWAKSPHTVAPRCGT